MPDKKKGLLWVIVALNHDEDDLRVALTTILQDNSMIKLYDEQNSYMRSYGSALLEAFDLLRNKNLYYKSKVLDRFMEWKQEKAERESARQDDIGRIL